MRKRRFIEVYEIMQDYHAIYKVMDCNEVVNIRDLLPEERAKVYSYYKDFQTMINECWYCRLSMKQILDKVNGIIV